MKRADKELRSVSVIVFTGLLLSSCVCTLSTSFQSSSRRAVPFSGDEPSDFWQMTIGHLLQKDSLRQREFFLLCAGKLRYLLGDSFVVLGKDIMFLLNFRNRTNESIFNK